MLVTTGTIHPTMVWLVYHHDILMTWLLRLWGKSTIPIINQHYGFNRTENNSKNNGSFLLQKIQNINDTRLLIMLVNCTILHLNTNLIQSDHLKIIKTFVTSYFCLFSDVCCFGVFSDVSCDVWIICTYLDCQFKLNLYPKILKK